MDRQREIYYSYKYNNMDTENDFEKNNILLIFNKYTGWISWFNILKVIFKSNSLSINKKNYINIKYSSLNKTFHFVKTEIFSVKLWRKLTKFYLMTIISSDHKNEIQFFKNDLPCPWILKMIRRKKWFLSLYQRVYSIMSIMINELVR